MFVTQLPSLERWALLPFLGFSYPNLLLAFLNLLFLGTCIICFSQVLDLLGFTYLQSMDFQREPQSKHHLYCKQEKPAHCHGSLLLRLGTHHTKPNQRRTQNQPTRYYDQADASYELRPRGQLGWGSGLALAIWVGLGRVGQEVKKKTI